MRFSVEAAREVRLWITRVVMPIAAAAIVIDLQYPDKTKPIKDAIMAKIKK